MEVIDIVTRITAMRIKEFIDYISSPDRLDAFIAFYRLAIPLKKVDQLQEFNNRP